jgi:hypothetical protein
MPSEVAARSKKPKKTGYGCFSFHTRKADNVAGIAWAAATPSVCRY